MRTILIERGIACIRLKIRWVMGSRGEKTDENLEG